MNAAVVGCGMIASRWIRTILADGRITPVAMVDIDQPAAAALAAKHGLAIPTFTTLDAAITAGPIDVVVNLAPPDHHAAISTQALEAGLHVLTEKPLATTYADARRLIDLAAHHHRRLHVMQNRGRDPRWREFARQTRSRDDGALHITADTVVDLRHPGFRTRQTRVATIDLAVHVFDQVRLLVQAPPVAVLARETPLPFLAPHCAATSIIVEFADSSVLSYRGSFTPGPVPRSSADGRWLIHGRDVHAVWDGEEQATLTDTATTAPTVLTLPHEAASYATCITQMIDSLTGAAPGYPDARDNLGSIALLDAALTSHASGRVAHPAQDRR